MAVWDWYATFCELAGVSALDTRAAAAGLPPIDSLSMLPVLLGSGPSPRKELPLGTEPRKSSLFPAGTTVNGLIELEEETTTNTLAKTTVTTRRLWKLLTGPIWEAGWTGPQFPNASTNTPCFEHPKGPVNPPGACIQDCANGTCLYHLSIYLSIYLSRFYLPSISFAIVIQQYSEITVTVHTIDQLLLVLIVIIYVMTLMSCSEQVRADG
jgi:hypothetical protein